MTRAHLDILGIEPGKMYVVSTLATPRQALPPAALEAALERGKTLNLEEIVARLPWIIHEHGSCCRQDLQPYDVIVIIGRKRRLRLQDRTKAVEEGWARTPAPSFSSSRIWVKSLRRG